MFSMAAAQSAIANAEPMRITRVDAVTFRKDIKIGGGAGGSEETEFCWVRIHTDKGLVGTGETYPYHQGEIGALKDYARTLMRQDPRNIDAVYSMESKRPDILNGSYRTCWCTCYGLCTGK
jgi:L-alanine-DL-glutamate epimerase-like enolase superfamily enzyme